MVKIENLIKNDSANMLSVYQDWPNLGQEYFEKYETITKFTNFNHIVFAGMGGSGALGDIFSSILSKTDIHSEVVKGYVLPKTVSKNSLIIVTSVSGNTIETYEVLKGAKKSFAQIIVFSSGGKIEKYCKNNNLMHIKINQINSPRSSFVNYFYSMSKSLLEILPIEESNILESINEMKKLKRKIGTDNLSDKNPAFYLAKWIKHIPMIYYPMGLKAASIRFKNSLQENAKIHAVSEDLFEASHNGIVGWEKKSNVQPILIKGEDDHPKTKERWKIFELYFKKNNLEFRTIRSVRGDITSKLINLIYFVDFTSIYTALLNNIDPTPVKSIEFIKNRL